LWECGQYISDGGLFNQSSLAEAIEKNIPTPEADEDTDVVLPYVFVADKAFALKENILMPYGQRNVNNEQRIFNYRLSRARRTVENAFGILSQRFRIFNRPIQLHPSKVELVTMTGCCLHNFLLRDSASASVYTASSDDCLTNSMPNIARQGSSRPSDSALSVRNKFAHYFNSEHGEVPWQESVLQK